MAGEFENYKERKGMWFWMMLSIAAVICEDPDMSARKSDHIVKDFLESSFFQYIFEDAEPKTLSFKR